MQTFAVRAWNMMEGRVDWQALPVICDLFGITDVEQLVDDLLTIREHMRRKHG